MHARRVAANDSFVPYGVDAADATRSALAVSDRDRRLRLLDGDTLAEQCAWQLGDDAVGTHAVLATEALALVSGVASVTLLDARGDVVWTYRHDAAWKQGNFEGGCAWFDAAGEPFALVPRTGHDGRDLGKVIRAAADAALERLRVKID